MQGKIYVLCGKSGCGKDTVYRAVQEELGLIPIVSTTTRPMRPNEQDGREYFFITQEDFKERESREEFVETRVYHTFQNGEKADWYYGISKKSIDLEKGDHIVIVDLNGLREIREAFRGKVVSIYIDVEDVEREQRARARGGFEKAEWNRRLLDDSIQFCPSRVRMFADHIVPNNNIDQTVELVKNIILDK